VFGVCSCDELAGPAKASCTADFYELFGVKRPKDRTPAALAALKQQLKQQRKRVLFALHPDKNRDPRASSAFDKAQDAYEVLTLVGAKLAVRGGWASPLGGGGQTQTAQV
jgi:hypothetical protein